MRFALITTFYPPFHFGGDALYVRNLAHALAARGHQVDVIHASDAYITLGGKQHKALAEPENVSVFRLQSRFPRVSTLIMHQLGSPFFHAAKIRSILNSRKYDVIHYHNVSLIGGPEVLRYGNALKLYTAHEHWLVCPTHILWKNNREICTSKACFRCGLSYKRPPQLWRYTNKLQRCARHVDKFLSLSEFSANAHRKFGFEQEFTIFPTSVPVTHTNADNVSTPAEAVTTKPYFLFVGRLEPIKGAQDITPLFSDDIDATLLIAGTGEMEVELKTRIPESANITFLGHVDPEKLHDIYRNATAVIIPSRCAEVFPLVALEAFRAGVPIVAKNSGPFPNIVEQSNGGVTYNNTDELRELLNGMLREPKKTSLMGLSGNNAFKKFWTEEVVFKNYFKLIKETAVEKNHTQILKKLSGIDAQGYLHGARERYKKIETDVNQNHDAQLQ